VRALTDYREEDPERGQLQPVEDLEDPAPAGDIFEASTDDLEAEDFITLSSAVDRFGVSRATLRRRLREGRLPRAYKAPGPQGEEWYLPVPDLRSLGYREVEETIEAARELAHMGTMVVATEESSGLQILRQLVDLLERERQRIFASNEALDRASREREQARLRVASLEAELEAERKRRDTAEQLVATFVAEEHRKAQAARDHLDRLMSKPAPPTLASTFREEDVAPSPRNLLPNQSPAGEDATSPVREGPLLSAWPESVTLEHSGEQSGKRSWWQRP
jgi:hypothetical protein